MSPFERVIRRVDRFQQTHAPLAVAFALIKKFGDDRAGSLAALIAYYACLAVFPLLLLLTTILGFAMDRNSALRRSVLDSALRDFPIVGQQLGEAIQPLQGNALALTVGAGLHRLGLPRVHPGQPAGHGRGVERPRCRPAAVRACACSGASPCSACSASAWWPRLSSPPSRPSAAAGWGGLAGLAVTVGAERRPVRDGLPGSDPSQGADPGPSAGRGPGRDRLVACSRSWAPTWSVTSSATPPRSTGTSPRCWASSPGCSSAPS